MKRVYKAPIAKKIDYAYQEQVVAQSLPVQNYVDAWLTNKVCTWGEAGCSWVYNMPKMARGLDDCEKQGNIPLD